MNEFLPSKYSGFAIASKFASDIESRAIISTCILNKIPFQVFKTLHTIPKDMIPVGDVKFVEAVLGRHVVPDYYPEYLKPYLKREIWRTDEWPLGKKVFIKPSDHYKRFTGFVTNGGYKGKKRPPYICSEVIRIKDEWRYYVSNGEILFSNWYAGVDDTEKDAPGLDIEFDKGLCCCLDMGETIDGEIVLIEQQHPFACGWYGKNTTLNNQIYTKWIADGWEFISNGYNP